MPALVSKSDGSSGISEEEGRRLQPFSSKKRRYSSRISAVVTYFIVLITYLSLFLALTRVVPCKLARPTRGLTTRRLIRKGSIDLALQGIEARAASPNRSRETQARRSSSRPLPQMRGYPARVPKRVLPWRHPTSRNLYGFTSSMRLAGVMPRYAQDRG